VAQYSIGADNNGSQFQKRRAVMNFSTIFLVIAAIASNVLASIVLKSAAIQTKADSFALPPTKVLLLGGLAVVFYGVTFVVYAILLRTLPVSKAYGLITFGAQTTLLLAGAVFFGERYELTAWIGIGMVMVGLILLAHSAGT
jgi:small multidrug resistance pump